MTANDLIWHEGVLSTEEIQEIVSIGKDTGYTNIYGEDTTLFQKELMSSVASLPLHNTFSQQLKTKLQNYFTQDFIFHSIALFTLYKPWDIHADWKWTDCEDGYVPYYNILISMDNVDSQTIVFDQYTTSSNKFSDYKKYNSKVDNPIPMDVWNKYLDYCWPDDRDYLTIKQIMPKQTMGCLQGIPRKYFHASDNFHYRFSSGKTFLQVRIDSILE